MRRVAHLRMSGKVINWRVNSHQPPNASASLAHALTCMERIEIFDLVLPEGIEPSRPKALLFENSVSTNSTTGAGRGFRLYYSQTLCHRLEPEFETHKYQTSLAIDWCGKGDSNPHARNGHQTLILACLPNSITSAMWVYL